MYSLFERGASLRDDILYLNETVKWSLITKGRKNIY